ncbi:SH3 domain-containing protein [Flavobacterium procerum]|uniref:SH3 domain-containing protein n=1 Tax=Flavobacterium procerum TaxID=1455569 RepID=A0ABV6BXE8_9FLAO
MKKKYHFFLLIFVVNSYSQVNVKGYYKSNGTYVQPHQRTAPNSTVIDNYSYQGNYNPNISYGNYSQNNNYNHISSTNTESEWIEGYYRNDGTYVNGYYRAKEKESNKTDNFSVKKYINATQVNVRTTPEITENIISKLNYGDEITSLYNFGDWEKVSVKKYNTFTYGYDNYEGYISSKYLSSYSSQNKAYYIKNNQNYYTESNLEYNINYKVITSKAYFHSTPNIYNQNKAYLVFGEIITAIGNSQYFVYIEFTNANGVKTNGWILKNDIVKY